MEQRRLVGIEAAARMLGVHANTLRRWADEGIVPHIRLPSGYRRFEVEELETFRASMKPHNKKAATCQDT